MKLLVTEEEMEREEKGSECLAKERKRDIACRSVKRRKRRWKER